MIIATIILIVIIFLIGYLLNMAVPVIIVNGLGVVNTLWTLGMNILTTILDKGLSGLGGLDTVKYIANDVLGVIAGALLVCFSLAEIARSSASLLDTKRWETVVKSLMKITIIGWIMTKWYDLVETIYDNVFTGIARDLMTSLGMNNMSIPDLAQLFGSTAPGTLGSTFKDGDVNFWDGFNFGWSGQSAADAVKSVLSDLIPIWGIIALILAVMLVTSALSTLTSCVTSLGTRMLRILLHVAVGPLALSTLPCHETSFVARKYITSFLGVSIEAMLAVITLSIFPGFMKAFISTNVWMSGVGVIVSGDSFPDACLAFAWFAIGCTTCFGILKTVIGALDQYSGQMLGLGGA